MSTPLYLELPVEIEQLLVEMEITIADILQRANIDADVAYRTRPDMSGEGLRSKGVELVILASATLILAIGQAVSQVMKTHHRRVRLVQVQSIEEVRDADGNVIAFKNVERPELLEPRKMDSKRELEARYLNEQGFVLRFGTDEREMNVEE